MRPRYLTLVILLPACDRSDSRPAAQPDTARGAVAARPTLRFEDYPVADTSLGRARPAGVAFASADYGRMYGTKLRQGAAEGPNFAGHYTVVTWGCGTGCGIVAVVDARTGRLSEQTLLTGNGLQFRRDSRLLYADPPTPEQPADCASCGTPAFYEWRDGRFLAVGGGPHPHLGGPRPWRTDCAPSDTMAGATTGLYTCPERTSR
jgi:hypothetical protein